MADMSSNTAAMVAEHRALLSDPDNYRVMSRDEHSALLGALSAQAKELEEAREREAKAVDDLCRWRDAFQRVTPGGSEFFDPKAVREWADKLKMDVFEVNKRAVLTTRQRDEALAALKASEARVAELVAQRDDLNACCTRLNEDADKWAAKARDADHLTEAMIRAACREFYKTDNIDGVSLAFRGADYTFRSAFTRMWEAATQGRQSLSRARAVLATKEMGR